MKIDYLVDITSHIGDNAKNGEYISEIITSLKSRGFNILGMYSGDSEKGLVTIRFITKSNNPGRAINICLSNVLDSFVENSIGNIKPKFFFASVSLIAR